MTASPCIGEASINISKTFLIKKVNNSIFAAHGLKSVSSGRRGALKDADGFTIMAASP
jgi:hypothetical protein